jgi:hypothetical protein
MLPGNSFLRSGSTSRSTSNAELGSSETNVEPGIPLQDRPRISTETTRWNRFRQFVAPDRATRIMEDITNGEYVLQLFILLSSSVPLLTRVVITVPFAPNL